MTEEVSITDENYFLTSSQEAFLQDPVEDAEPDWMNITIRGEPVRLGLIGGK